MKKVIRNKTTGAFLTDEGEWTADVLKARHFARAADAAAAKRSLQLDGAELYYSFADNQFESKWDFAIPLE